MFRVQSGWKPTGLKGSLILFTDFGEPQDLWECEHTHPTTEDADKCAKAQLEHVIEMLKP